MKQTNNACDTCPLRDGCIERRGICRDYILYMERVERVQKEIEKLNETTEKVFAAGPIPANQTNPRESVGDD